MFFFDVDGVLLDLSTPFAAHAAHLGRSAADADWNALWQDFLASPAVSALPALVAPQAFNEVADRHEVHLITGFPAAHHLARVDNLRRHGFRYRALHFVQTTDKAAFIQRASLGRPVVFMEDDPAPLRQLQSLMPQATLLQYRPADGAYAADPLLPTVESWAAFLARVQVLAQGGERSAQPAGGGR